MTRPRLLWYLLAALCLELWTICLRIYFEAVRRHRRRKWRSVMGMPVLISFWLLLIGISAGNSWMWMAMILIVCVPVWWLTWRVCLSFAYSLCLIDFVRDPEKGTEHLRRCKRTAMLVGVWSLLSMICFLNTWVFMTLVLVVWIPVGWLSWRVILSFSYPISLREAAEQPGDKGQPIQEGAGGVTWS